MVYLSLVTYEIGKFRGKWQANTLTWLSVYINIFIVILDFCSFLIANVSYISQYKVFVVDAAAKQTTCFYETTPVFMFPVQCALASPTLDGFCLACISPRIQHHPITHCSVIAGATTSSRRILQPQNPSLLWRCANGRQKCKHSNSTQFLGPPPGNLDLSPDLSPSHLRFSSGATAVIRHSQTTSATSSWNSLKKISASSVENPWPRAVEVKFWYKPLIKYTDLPTLRAGPPSPITNGVKTVKTLPETNGLPLKTGLNSPKGNYQ